MSNVMFFIYSLSAHARTHVRTHAQQQSALPGWTARRKILLRVDGDLVSNSHKVPRMISCQGQSSHQRRDKSNALVTCVRYYLGLQTAVDLS